NNSWRNGRGKTGIRTRTVYTIDISCLFLPSSARPRMRSDRLPGEELSQRRTRAACRLLGADHERRVVVACQDLSIHRRRLLFALLAQITDALRLPSKFQYMQREEDNTECHEPVIMLPLFCAGVFCCPPARARGAPLR